MNRGAKHRERDTYTDDYNRSGKRHKDDFSSRGGSNVRIDPQYKTLCVSHFNPRMTDKEIEAMIFREFKKYGDFNISVLHAGNNRIAHVIFRYSEDACAAKAAYNNKNPLFEAGVRVDTVYSTVNLPSPVKVRDDYSYRSGSPHLARSVKDNYNSGPRDPGYHPYESQSIVKMPLKSDKYLHQDDGEVLATRTLFVGNLEFDITVEQLTQIFERFGVVEDVDIKRPSAQGHGNIYAFIRFFNLDMAHHAKMEMSGQYIRKYACRIGYGKPIPSNCVWVGNIGPWLTKDDLLRTFSQFGPVVRLEWPPAKSYAYVLYGSVECASAAVQALRGIEMGGRCIKIDFADESHITSPLNLTTRVVGGGYNGRSGYDLEPDVDRTRDQRFYSRDPGNRDWQPSKNLTENRRDIDLEPEKKGDYERHSNSSDRRRTADRLTGDHSAYRTQIRKEEVGHSDSRKRTQELTASDGGSEHRNSDGGGNDVLDRAKIRKSIEDATSVLNLAKCLDVVWRGELMLKSSTFLTRMHLLSGDVRLVDTLMRDVTSTEKPILKITQRLRLDSPKLIEVQRRLTLAGQTGCSILLAMPVDSSEGDVANNSQQRPLKSLVAYLKQKEAAGVVSLPPNVGPKHETGLLHAFPSCPFAQQFLTKFAPKLSDSCAKEDHLLILVERVAS